MFKSAVHLPRLLASLQCFFALSLCLVLLLSCLAQDPAPVDQIISRLYLGDSQSAIQQLDTLADIDSRSSSGSTVLIAVAMIPGLNQSALYERLFQRHPNCNLKDKTGLTALYYAASLGKIELVDKLVARGADPNVNSDYGSPLVGAVQNHQEVVAQRLLLLANLNLDLADRYGRTALIFAVIHRDLNLVQTLTAKGANPNIYETITGNSPLIWSSQGPSDLVALLLDSKADPSLRNPFNCQTVVHVAVTAQNLVVLRLLLDRDVNPGLADSAGRTPLGIAHKLGNEPIADILVTTLRSKGMNVSDIGQTPPNCHSDRLTTTAQAMPLRSPETAEDNFLPFARAVTARWETQHNIFLNRDVPEFTADQIKLFKEITCSTRNPENLVSQCQALLADKSKLERLITESLDQTFVEKRPTTTWLAAILSDSIGVDFSRAGYAVHGPNTAVCSPLPDDYAKDSALFVNADGLYELSPGVTLCLRPDTYDVIIPAKHLQLNLNYDSANRKPTASVASLDPTASLTATHITTPAQLICPGIDGAQSPLTLPLPLRDDIKIAKPTSFSTVTSVNLTVKADPGVCDAACLLAVKYSLIQAIGAWKAGCTRCSLSNLFTIRFEDISYFNVQTVNILTGYLSAGRPFPNPNDRVPLSGSGVLSGYEKLDRSLPQVSKLCGANLPGAFTELCQNSDASSPMNIVLELSKQPDTCFTRTNVACASPNGVIRLRAIDHSFAIKRIASSAPIRFGAGSVDLDLLAVLIHELGHFFGLPHMDDESFDAQGRPDVMLPTYNPTGVCITGADYSMLNKAVDPDWPFRLDGCVGLRY